MSDVVGDPIVERVAEAIWRADQLGPDVTLFADILDDCQGWYEHMARAAIEALGLEPDWALATGGGRVYFMSEQSAKEKAERWPESFHVQSRLVTPWRVGGDT